jgi:hypothetical protein
MKEEYQDRARGTVDTLSRMLQDLSRHYFSPVVEWKYRYRITNRFDCTEQRALERTCR